MARRLTPQDLDNTEVLLGEILSVVLPTDERISFLVPSGRAKDYIARIRVKMSRTRAKLARQKRKLRRFQLNSTVHPETYDGKRFDCIVMWKHVLDSHIVAEKLEDLLANG